MAKAKQLEEQKNFAYGTALAHTDFRANHKIRSKYVAGALSILLGVFGVQWFYLGKFVRGIIELVVTILFAVVCMGVFDAAYVMVVPIGYAVIRGLMLLASDDEAFGRKYRVRNW